MYNTTMMGERRIYVTVYIEIWHTCMSGNLFEFALEFINTMLFYIFIIEVNTMLSCRDKAIFVTGVPGANIAKKAISLHNMRGKMVKSKVQKQSERSLFKALTWLTSLSKVSKV